MLLPADCCAVTPETFAALAAEADGDAVIYPSHRGRRGHPPVIPARYADKLLSYDGEGGAKGFLAALPARGFEVADAGVLLDMDTPEDYSALLSHLGLPTAPGTRGELRRLLGGAKYSPEELFGRLMRSGYPAAAVAARNLPDGSPAVVDMLCDILYKE
jgi:hypothetical protein